MTETKAATKRPRELHCSFCRKSQTEVEKLVAGPGVYICDRCIDLAEAAARQSDGSGTPETMFQDHWPTEKLISFLKMHDGAFEHIDRAMQDIVDILRERDVSWAQIGEVLGVSRQAAWKRFG
jgi:hypothetical protein